MRLSRPVARGAAAALALAAVAYAGPASAATGPTALPPGPGGAPLQLIDANARGDVLVRWNVPAPEGGHRGVFAVLDRRQRLHVLKGLEFTTDEQFNTAEDINASGEVAGSRFVPFEYQQGHALVWRGPDSEPEEISPVPGEQASDGYAAQQVLDDGRVHVSDYFQNGDFFGGWRSWLCASAASCTQVGYQLDSDEDLQGVSQVSSTGLSLLSLTFGLRDPQTVTYAVHSATDADVLLPLTEDGTVDAVLDKEQGTLLGSSSTAAGVQVPVTWPTTGGRPTALPLPAGATSGQALGTTSHGDTYGRTCSPTTCQVTIWSRRHITTLGPVSASGPVVVTDKDDVYATRGEGLAAYTVRWDRHDY